jgi:hypothetical protein
LHDIIGTTLCSEHNSVLDALEGEEIRNVETKASCYALVMFLKIVGVKKKRLTKKHLYWKKELNK